MKHLRKSLEAIYHAAIDRQYDRIVPVIGNEGVGKSTLMLRMVLNWQDITGELNEQNPIDRLVWGDRSAFKRAIIDSEKQSVIAVMDAARVLHKKEAMHGDQKDLQKSLLDSRYKENLILLGYQSWGDIPTFLQRRRAANAAVIPRRGVLRWYNREMIDKRHRNGEWPEPIFREPFRSLEGTELWERFQERDQEEKERRMLGEEDLSPADIRWREQAKVALRATKPWSNDEGMTQRDAAELIDYSRGWIQDRAEDWRRGDLELDLPVDTVESQDSTVVA